MKKAARLRFADAIIILCVVMLALITAAVIYEYHRLDTVLPAGVLGVLVGAWCGELLTIALRQVFGSDVLTQAKAKTTTYKTEETI